MTNIHHASPANPHLDEALQPVISYQLATRPADEESEAKADSEEEDEFEEDDELDEDDEADDAGR